MTARLLRSRRRAWTVPALEVAAGLLAAAFVVQTHYLLTSSGGVRLLPRPGDIAASLDGFALGSAAEGEERQAASSSEYRADGGRHYPGGNRSAYNVTDPTNTFCPHCDYHKDCTCDQRVAFLMKRYKIDESEARNNDAVKERCNYPPPVWLPTFAGEDEPAVILHIGPHKTGTTALQAFMYDLIYTDPNIFIRDGVRVPSFDELPGLYGKEGVGLNLAHCSLRYYMDSGGQMNIGMCSGMRDKFPKFMVDAYRRRQDVVIVAEDFDKFDDLNMDRLRFFLRPYVRIKVVTFYRRLQDWLPSWYNQIVDHYTTIYAKGEERYPSIVDWMAEHYENKLEVHAPRLAEKYRRLSWVESATMINMHEHFGPDLIGHFFCSYLNASGACRAARDGRMPSKTNVGEGHELSRLAIAASLAGKISTNLVKPVNLIRISRKIGQRLNETGLAMPEVCVEDSTLAGMLRLEMEEERGSFPDWYKGQGGDAALERSFERARSKFCSLDVDRTVNSTRLDDIFNEVDNTNPYL